MNVHTLEEAQTYLFQFIPAEVTYKSPASLGLERTKELLKYLDNPQDKVQTIHIAGTSGKGSTAYFTSLLLHALGYKTGLHLSPHLIDIRERMEINNTFIKEKTFVQYLNEIIPSIEKLSVTSYGKPTIFEVLVCLAFYTFWKEDVDFAVIETGLGGLYDATNSINSKNKIVILTKIGLDHIQILGKTIDKIALQKAEIIKNGNMVISAKQHPHAKHVIDAMVHKRNAQVFYQTPQMISHINTNNTITQFDFNFEKFAIKKLQMSTLGNFQLGNVSLTLILLSKLLEKKQIVFNEGKIRSALLTSYFPGRFDKKRIQNKEVILDGAHNPQKMASLIKSLKQSYPKKKFHFLLSFKQGKNYLNMLKYIVPIAHSITVTDFYVKDENLTNISEDPKVITSLLDKLSFKNYDIIKDPNDALNTILKNTLDIVVVTGSLYFLSVIYKTLNTQKKTSD